MKRRRSRNRVPPLDPRVWLWLSTGVDDDSFAVFGAQDRVRELWAEYGVAATVVFAKSNPGRRHEAWWQCTAPEPRRRLGGAGVPCFVALNFVEQYSLGVPTSWIQPDDWRYYNGQVRDGEGALIDTGYQLGDFLFQPVDRNDPPLFESQAAYLRRLALLLPGELTADDFQPERLHDAIEDELDDGREDIEDID